MRRRTVVLLSVSGVLGAPPPGQMCAQPSEDRADSRFWGPVPLEWI